MYKLSVPVSLKLITDDNINIYLKQLKDIKADRVFLIGFGKIYTPDSLIHNNPEKISNVMDILRNEGYEVGFWVGAFGHGQVLVQSTPSEQDANYTSIEGVNGEIGAEALCPLDKSFEKDFLNNISLEREYLFEKVVEFYLETVKNNIRESTLKDYPDVPDIENYIAQSIDNYETSVNNGTIRFLLHDEELLDVVVEKRFPAGGGRGNEVIPAK
jgi:hypothetical protein